MDGRLAHFASHLGLDPPGIPSPRPTGRSTDRRGKLLFEDGEPLTFGEFMDAILTLRGTNQTTVKDRRSGTAGAGLGGRVFGL